MSKKDKLFEELLERTKGDARFMTDDDVKFVIRYALSKMTLKDFYNTAFGQCVCWGLVSAFFISIFFTCIF